MVRRSSKSNFSPGVYAFPGGTVETADCTALMEENCFGLTLQQAQSIIKDATHPNKVLGFFVAAIREAFEEVGILLAYRRDQDLIVFDGIEEARFVEYRRQMQESPFFFGEILRREKLKLATDRLFYCAHWITPEVFPLRFDTRFFIAAAPSNQKALHDELEITASKWITPQEALEKHKQSEFPLLPPTIFNLTTLTKFSSLDEVVASIERKEIPTLMPEVIVKNGQAKIRLPWEQL
jgi:8-oxo-dGTP pyrophosphatase MutT (NUDIX family)